MKTLFLASKIEKTIDLLIAHYGLKPSLTPTVYIPTAQNCYKPTPILEERGSYRCLVTRNFPITICDLAQENPKNLKEKLAKAKLIVGAGGNSYYLLHHMKQSGFAKFISLLLAKGVIYAGSSAGSCVCSPDISYIGDQDDASLAPDLIDNTGLNQIDFEIYPHCIEDYATNYSADFITTSLKSNSKKQFLRDNQAIVVDDDWYQMLSSV